MKILVVMEAPERIGNTCQAAKRVEDATRSLVNV